MTTWVRDHPIATALVGTLLAIASTAALDAVGFGLNVLPLAVLFFFFWFLQHLSRTEIGLTWGRPQDYGVAVFYPVLVLALIGLVAWLGGAASFHSIDWANTLGTFALQLIITAVLGLITEEGVFRGWLWATLERAKVSGLWVLVFTSAAFAAWHISTALLPTAFRPPLAQVPVYILNAGVIGFNWALMRRRSGSILVTSVSHGFWNALVYTLFGYGTTLGALGIHNTAMFGPEIGLVGLAANLVSAAILWLAYGGIRQAQAEPEAQPTRI